MFRYLLFLLSFFTMTAVLVGQQQLSDIQRLVNNNGYFTSFVHAGVTYYSKLPHLMEIKSC